MHIIRPKHIYTVRRREGLTGHRSR